MVDVRDKISTGQYENKRSYNQDPEAWRLRNRQLEDQFWADVREQFDAEKYDQAKWTKLCQIAWDEGHSYGYSEVLIWIEQLLELIEP